MIRRLRALARILMTPVAADLIATAYHSPTARGLARQAVRDPAGLARRLADPKESVPLMRQAGRQLSLRDMAQLGLLFAPLRYGILSELAIWGARRATGRGGGRSARRAMKNVTPRDAGVGTARHGHRAQDRADRAHDAAAGGRRPPAL